MLFILFACFTSYTFLWVRGQEGEYVHAVLCCCSCPLCACARVRACMRACVRVRGTGANLNTVKRIVTLHWNQTNLIYNNLSEKSKLNTYFFQINCYI